MRKQLTAALATAGIAIAAAAGCATATTSHTAPASHGTTPAAAQRSHGIGDTFTVTTKDDNGQPATYKVTLLAIDQHATVTDSLYGHTGHEPAAQFRVTGVSGTASGDPDLGLSTYENANGYSTALYADTVSDGPSFTPDGTWMVHPGQSQTGWVGLGSSNAKVTSFTWQDGSTTYGAPTYTWDIP